MTQDMLALFGRSSSHFTRVARLFAAELGVSYSFRIVPDLLSTDADAYGGNPALKIPSLQTPHGVWFGALNVCRELGRLSDRKLRIVWPEELDRPLTANAQELVVTGMATEVALILAKLSGTPESAHQLKMRQSLLNTLEWLEAHSADALSALPDRDLSFLEVTLFCFVTHVAFRDVLPTSPYPNLNEFCRSFGARPAAIATEYRFDP